MGRIYFDTSALVKRYQVEQGTDIVDRLFAESESQVVISRLGVVETSSALAMRVRAGELPIADFVLVRKRFLSEVAHGMLAVARLTASHYRIAERLIEQHAPIRRLRTLDALQLGVALELQKDNRIDTFVCADRTLCEIAVLAGLQVVNPLNTT